MDGIGPTSCIPGQFLVGLHKLLGGTCGTSMFTCFACLLDGSAVDQFKKHFSHLEEGGGAAPPERQHTSLPRFLKYVFGSG
jgi:hypothetical protein